MKIGENLKKLRKRANLTQEEAAKLFGFKNHTGYAHWESDKNSPSIRDLDRIAEVFGTTVSELLFNSGVQVKTIEVEVERVPKEVQQRLEFLEREIALYRAALIKEGWDLSGKSEGVTISPELDDLIRGNNTEKPNLLHLVFNRFFSSN